jgi:hypothetical protein
MWARHPDIAEAWAHGKHTAKRKEIITDWNDMNSIRKSERQKALYENKGYKQIETKMLSGSRSIVVYQGSGWHGQRRRHAQAARRR